MILLELFWTFFKIGLFTFGGGYAMIPLIRSEVVSRGWVSSSELIDFIAVSESTPGPFAVNIATFVGRTTAGLPGAVLATLGVVLPSFLVILVVSAFYEKFKESNIVKGVMTGVKPAVIGLIASTLLLLGEEVFISHGSDKIVPSLFSVAVFAITFVLAIKKNRPIFIISVSAALGIIAGYCLKI